ncbi:hypothetical protein O3G_MSEX014515 [Manduca sexta]|uniref:MADF domain-containing protein n=1 Tax=Manduca sexta TaxID=7130 RepID=A0A921ZUL3_MANSE|nr:hypothetical protein O3G_MSEX014515 [Manduca sexta]
MSKFNDKLIEMVKIYPVLYDPSHSDFKNVFLKKTIWDEIGQTFNMRGERLKCKWKNLRDTYSRYLKSKKALPVSLSNKRYSRWHWASSMEFMKDILEVAVPDSSITEGDNTPTNNVRKRIYTPLKRLTDNKLVKTTATTAHLDSRMNKMSATEHVMLGYAKILDGLTERRKIFTKMKIAQIIMEAELEDEQERSLEVMPLQSDKKKTDSFPSNLFVIDPNSYTDPLATHSNPLVGVSSQSQTTHSISTSLDLKREIVEDSIVV